MSVTSRYCIFLLILTLGIPSTQSLFCETSHTKEGRRSSWIKYSSLFLLGAATGAALYWYFKQPQARPFTSKPEPTEKKGQSSLIKEEISKNVPSSAASNQDLQQQIPHPIDLQNESPEFQAVYAVSALIGKVGENVVDRLEKDTARDQTEYKEAIEFLKKRNSLRVLNNEDENEGPTDLGRTLIRITLEFNDYEHIDELTKPDTENEMYDVNSQATATPEKKEIGHNQQKPLAKKLVPYNLKLLRFLIEKERHVQKDLELKQRLLQLRALRELHDDIHQELLKDIRPLAHTYLATPVEPDLDKLDELQECTKY
jgi:hypothetical protein